MKDSNNNDDDNNCEIAHEKVWIGLWKGNLNRVAESLLITAQNNAISNNHLKMKIDNLQENSLYTLYGDRKIVNYVISVSKKLWEKEYKSWLGDKGDL